MVSYLYTAMGLIGILGAGVAAVAYASLLTHVPTKALRRAEQGAVVLLMAAIIVAYLTINIEP